jgi:hypothetical protein
LARPALKISFTSWASQRRRWIPGRFVTILFDFSDPFFLLFKDSTNQQGVERSFFP